MPKPGRRRITLFDIMALIAATALGLGIARVGFPPKIVTYAPFGFSGRPLPSPSIKPTTSGYRSREALGPIAKTIAPFFSVMAAWGLALIASGLVPPRLRWRRLGRRPGFVAAVAVAAVWLIEAPLAVGISWYDGRFGWNNAFRNAQGAANFTIQLGHHSALAVAVAWLALALGGRWGAERDWIDRSGRLLGLAWLVVGAICLVLVDQSIWWGDFLSP